jgi:hypothetical protein
MYGEEALDRSARGSKYSKKEVIRLCELGVMSTKDDRRVLALESLEALIETDKNLVGSQSLLCNLVSDTVR